MDVPSRCVEVTTFGDRSRVFMDPDTGQMYRVPYEERDVSGRVIRSREECQPSPLCKYKDCDPNCPFDAPEAPAPPKGFS